MDAASSISGCKAQGIVLTSGSGSSAGVFANKAAANATIKDCGASGTVDGEEISLESRFITTDAGAVVSGTYIISE